MTLNFNIKSQILDDINTIEALISSDFFNITNPYVQNACFTKLMICLRDLIYKNNKLSNPIDFCDDVIIEPDVKNVSQLIKFIRDALCHQDSENHLFGHNIYLSYSVFFGKIPNAMNIEGKIIGSDYEDDICIIFGTQKIYYKRHIIRAFNECKKNLTPIL